MKRAWLLLLAFVAFSQELQVSTGRMMTNSILRPRPDGTSPAVYQLAKDAQVSVLSERGEFVRVAGAKGPLGWVPKSAVEVTGAATPVRCPVVQALSKKNQGTAVILDFNDILKLQLQAERIAGMGHEISPQERGQLSSLAIAESRTGDGALVRLGGYFAAKPEGPRVSPACTGEAAGEWLLNITDGAGLKEYEGVVARISPVKRNAKWTLAKLQMAAEKQHPVLVTGTLFYDSAGFVNNESANPLPGTLRRSFLWELRNVTSILVCTGGTCEPGSSKGWLPLESIN